MAPDLNTLTISLSSFATGLNQPLGIAHAGDGSDRIFVVEKRGRIRIIENGVLLDTPFLDIRARVSTESERGLLGIAFSPSYAANGEFYLNYTDNDGNTVIARYQGTTNPNQANPDSEEVILTIDQPLRNHNGGQMAFGPDGYLYIGMGDGGGAGDPDNLAQDPSSLLGKMLRIDVESNQTYRVPEDNPFLAATDPNDDIQDEIWALGFRNPWRFSFDRATGDLYIADVGQEEREEINIQPADSPGGENYGWRVFEGTFLFNDTDPQPKTVTFPAAEYDHTEGQSITGGYVYRGTTPSDLTGVYLYGDFINGRIWGLKQDDSGVETTLLLDTDHMISTFGEDEAGNLYLADYDDGVIYAIAPPSLSSLPMEPPTEIPPGTDPDPDPDGNNPPPTELPNNEFPNNQPPVNESPANELPSNQSPGNQSPGNQLSGNEPPNGNVNQPPPSNNSEQPDNVPSVENGVGTAGDDLLQGQETDDILSGQAGDDTIQGGQGADILRGNRGNDLLLGGTKGDRLFGGPGNDRLVGQNGPDQLTGGSGRDRLLGGNGQDQLLGSSGADILNGGNGNDQLDGGSGPDQLRGNAGNDILRGNRGRDRLRGGAGQDTFVLELNAGPDQIEDFQPNRDRFDLPNGLTFNDISVQQQANNTTILVDDQRVATVLNTQAEQLIAEQFI